jgi:hypothetical protein
MSPAAPRFTFLAIAGLAIAAGLILADRRTGKADAFTDIVRSEDFQAGQRYRRGGDGCIALTAMDDVDVLVVGSSQAYAGIDAVTLANRFAPQSTAVCALPAWTMDHFALLIEFLEEQRITPRRIIWIADAVSVLETSVTDARLERARETFQSKEYQDLIRGQWAAMIERTGSPFPIDAEERRRRLARQFEALTALSVSDIEAVITRRDMASFETLANLLEGAGPYPGRAALLAQFCAALDQRGIMLDVIVGPPPQATIARMQALDNPDLPASLEALGSDLEAWLPCARRVIARDASGWGLDLRHYVNRMGDSDYPYEVWRGAEAYAAYADRLGRTGRIDSFDGNHLNLAGAALFTEAMIDALD